MTDADDDAPTAGAAQARQEGVAPDFRSGFVALVGRPNVGKSTLVNRAVGRKVAITSSRPQTTRTEIRGVRTTPASQIVFLDTPGIHKPRTALGERTNARACATLDEVDVVCLVIEASAPIGRGDRFIVDLVHAATSPSVLVVNKVDIASSTDVFDHLATATGALGEFDAYVPLSALTGDGVDALIGEIETRIPEGPMYFPAGEVTDQPETFLAAELVREQLLRVARDELPHSIMAVAEPLDDEPDHREPDSPLRLRVVIRVERESQKGMVIGKGGAVLKEAGTNARLELEALLGVPVYLETVGQGRSRLAAPCARSGPPRVLRARPGNRVGRHPGCGCSCSRSRARTLNRSPRVTMPTSLPSPSTTGVWSTASPVIRSRTSSSVSSGPTVTTPGTAPLRFTGSWRPTMPTQRPSWVTTG